jgi:hypothetical protein
LEYKLKRGFRPETERIKEVLEMHFSVPVKEVDGKLRASYSALASIEAWIADKKLYVETESNPDASDEEIMETNSRFRKFLYSATGYTSNQRVKMAKKET